MAENHISSDQHKRFATFRITEKDVDLLKASAGFAEQKLPRLLEEWNSRFSDWPEIQTALRDPQVHSLRVAHWVRAASGRFGDGFMDSAKKLAVAFYDHGVPGYAVAICHSTVVNGIIEDLKLEEPCRGFGAAKEQAKKDALRNAVQKAAWFDLEVLMEVYAVAEQESRRKQMHTVAETFETKVKLVVEALSTSSEHMGQIVGSLSQTASRSTDASTSVAAAAEQASSNVSVVATAAEQLELAVQEIAGQVQTSTTIASQAVTRAEETTETMTSLSVAVEKIGAVVDLIANIASQTNLLALNATIEAARAGEAGKGFAVVASEVKALASQTAKATTEIAEQIGNLKGIAGASVASIKHIRDIIERINESSTAIGAAIEEQDASTMEISRNIREVAQGNQQVSFLIQGAKDDANSTASIAGQVTTDTRDLNTQTVALNQAFDSFPKDVRAS